MGFAEKIKSVLAPNVQNTFKRFPVPILCSVILYVLVYTDVERSMNGLLPLSLTCGYFCFGIARLFSEAHQWPSYKEGLLGIILTTFITMLVFIAISNSGIIFFPLGLVLLGLAVAPFIFRKSDDFSFWLYNRLLWHGVSMGIVAGLLLAGGLSIAFLSINALFGFEVPKDIYGYLWTFSAIIYAPFIALSLVPQKFDVPVEDCPNSEGVTFALNWILAPLAVLYFAIFYAYGAKIIITGDMPKGQVAYMVLGFGLIGIFTYLTAAPLKDKSKALVKFLYKRFFLLLLPPAGFLAAATYLRIDQYGLTEPRYILVLITLWFVYLAIQFTWKPQTPIKTILTSFLLLLLFASFGPWGAAKSSELAQVVRLEKALARNKLLKDGKAIQAAVSIPKEDAAIISSTVHYLSKKKRGVWARRIIPELGSPMESVRNASVIVKNLNIDYIPQAEKYPSFSNRSEGSPKEYKNISYRASWDGPIEVAGFNTIYPQFFIHVPSNGAEGVRNFNMDLKKAGKESEALVLTPKALYFRMPGEPQVEIPITGIIATLENKRPIDKAALLVVDTEGNGRKLRLVLQTIELRDYGNGDRRIQSLHGYLLLGGSR